MGLGLPFGGHLTHGWGVNFSGIYYHAVAVRRRPGHASRRLEPRRGARARDAAEAHLLRRHRVSAHLGLRGLRADRGRGRRDARRRHRAHRGARRRGRASAAVSARDVVTTTTHKTLRGPRGGMILCDGAHAKAIDRAVFPGLQGGPHNHTTAAIAVALKEAATSEFRAYAQQIVTNAKALAAALLERGFRLISGGTDNHLILIDVTPRGITGKPAAKALDEAGIECNYNTIPFDPRKPFDPSGLRIGTPSVTSRGMSEKRHGADRRVDRSRAPGRGRRGALHTIRAEIADFCKAFPGARHSRLAGSPRGGAGTAEILAPAARRCSCCRCSHRARIPGPPHSRRCNTFSRPAGRRAAREPCTCTRDGRTRLWPAMAIRLADDRAGRTPPRARGRSRTKSKRCSRPCRRCRKIQAPPAISATTRNTSA